jgi:hypothetical protein
MSDNSSFLVHLCPEAILQGKLSSSLLDLNEATDRWRLTEETTLSQQMEQWLLICKD